MKAGTSSLNPYAESYVPLSKRGPFNGRTEFKTPDEAVAVGPPLWNPAVQASQTHNIHNADTYYPSATSGLITHAVHGYQSLSSYNPSELKEKATVEEVFEYDLQYLQTTFPGMSYESLSDVYVANNCDLDATVDMLSHLELYSGDSSEKLPDTLDIGDVPESGLPSELPSQKLKDLRVDAGASSSGVSG